MVAQANSCKLAKAETSISASSMLSSKVTTDSYSIFSGTISDKSATESNLFSKVLVDKTNKEKGNVTNEKNDTTKLKQNPLKTANSNKLNEALESKITKYDDFMSIIENENIDSEQLDILSGQIAQSDLNDEQKTYVKAAIAEKKEELAKSQNQCEQAGKSTKSSGSKSSSNQDNSIDDAQKKYDDLMAKNNQLAQSSEMQRANTELQNATQYEKLASSAQQQMTTAQSKLSGLTQNIASCETQMPTLEASAAELKQKAQSAPDEQKAEYEKSAKDAETALKQKQSELAELKRQKTLAEAELQQVTNDFNSYKSQAQNAIQLANQHMSNAQQMQRAQFWSNFFNSIGR